jgi:hypothetical protein
MMRESLLVDIAGWAGVAALLLAYGLVSLRRVAGDSLLYQLLNVIGGALLIVNSFYYGAFPSVGINVAWIVIGVLALVRIRFGRQRRHEPT